MSIKIIRNRILFFYKGIVPIVTSDCWVNATFKSLWRQTTLFKNAFLPAFPKRSSAFNNENTILKINCLFSLKKELLFYR